MRLSVFTRVLILQVLENDVTEYSDIEQNEHPSSFPGSNGNSEGIRIQSEKRFFKILIF